MFKKQKQNKGVTHHKMASLDLSVRFIFLLLLFKCVVWESGSPISYFVPKPKLTVQRG